MTLWQGSSLDNAIERAEGDAAEYASDLGMTYLGLAQAYKLTDEPADGAEVFSLFREIGLIDNAYLTASSTPGLSGNSRRRRSTGEFRPTLGRRGSAGPRAATPCG